MQSAEHYTRVGADIGGTFTDLVLIDQGGAVIRKKVPSTTGNYAQGIISALNGALEEGAYTPAKVAQIVHGTTVATNAILEQDGAVCGLVATKGFRDILELRRLRMPQLYRLDWNKPPVLARRDHRLEVNERIAANGEILIPLDPDEVAAVGEALAAQGVEAISIAFMNSYVNRFMRKWRRRCCGNFCRIFPSRYRRKSCRRSRSTSGPARRSSIPTCSRASRAISGACVRPLTTMPSRRRF
jgi:N-methylhydantoinase A